MGADMARGVWCKCRAHIAVRKGAENSAETGSGIERRNGETSQGKKYKYMAENWRKRSMKLFQAKHKVDANVAFKM